VEIRLGLPFLFLRTRLDPARIRGLRHHVPAAGSGTSWRGPYLSFDYAGTRMAIGPDLSPASAGHLAGLIRALPATAGSNPPGFYLATPPAQQADDDTVSTDTAPLISRDGALPLSTLVLVAANLVPVAGVLLFGWDLGKLMVLFRAESGIIGLYNLLKMPWYSAGRCFLPARCSSAISVLHGRTFFIHLRAVRLPPQQRGQFTGGCWPVPGGAAQADHGNRALLRATVRQTPGAATRHQ
jgi:hypothetical protein